MLRWFETRIDPFRRSPGGRPPTRLVAFYAHYLGQVWPAFAALMVTGLIAALIEVSLFAFVGRIVDMVRDAESPAGFFAEHGTVLMLMAAVALVVRPVFFTLHSAMVHQVINPPLTNMIRWQTHRYVLRQSLAFFQDDFAGRIAAKIIQTGPAVRGSAVKTADAVWFVIIYVTSALVLFSQADPRLAVPLVLWLTAFIGCLVYFVPRIKDRSAVMSEARSMMTGRIVDSYTNILTVKLFAHADREDVYARNALEEHTARFFDQERMITGMVAFLHTLNGAMMVGTCGLALWLWSQGAISIGAIALASGLVIRINNMSGWMMWTVTDIFEEVGRVQEGIESISRPYSVVDRPAAKPLTVTRGEIRYENIRFHYGKDFGVIDDLSLTIEPGEKVGLVGRSGAGKSTLVNLLLRFHDLEGGRIRIDGQDIAHVTQDSLRAAIGMVTQDTSLLHRSVLDNIRYSRPDASMEQIIAAAERAHAMEFIHELEDHEGRKGFDAHVGERGVKLSGGQRQRIAIARAILKNAPILLLDEATSALDTVSERQVQAALKELMTGRTTLVIAHRLSTVLDADLIYVIEDGRVVESGHHAALVKQGGSYARLYAMQLTDDEEALLAARPVPKTVRG